jgi:hypothetical protein
MFNIIPSREPRDEIQKTCFWHQGLSRHFFVNAKKCIDIESNRECSDCTTTSQEQGFTSTPEPVSSPDKRKGRGKQNSIMSCTNTYFASIILQLEDGTHANLLFTLPSRNRTNPVTTHADLNNTSLPSSGNESGMMTYPKSGMAPKAAKERNMMTPASNNNNEQSENIRQDGHVIKLVDT